MIFDTHCHYNLAPLSTDWRKHWQDAQAAGVLKTVVMGTDLQSSPLAIEIAKQDKNLYASVAIHPLEYNSLTLEVTEAVNQIETLLASAHQNKIVAIGETGLDYFHIEGTGEARLAPTARQKESLRQHLLLAKKYQLPVILHVRDRSEQAYWDTLEILQEVPYLGKFVLHCASGPMAYIQKAVEMGAYIGVAGNITYKNAEHLRELLRLTPHNKILLETDAPYLPPQQWRGRVCQPKMIVQTAEFLDHELHISPQTTWENAHTFFDLPFSAVSEVK